MLLKGNKSSSLESVLGTLRPAARALGQWGLSDEDGATLSKTVKFLQGVVPAESEPSKCFLLEELRAIVAWAKNSTSLSAPVRLQSLALLSALWGFMARGSEIVNSRCAEYLFDPELGARLLATLTKKDKEVIRPRARAVPHLPMILEDLCPTRLLQCYHQEVLAANGAAEPGNLFFPKLDASGRPTTVPLSTDDMKSIIAVMAQGAGVKVEGLDAHFGRTTGYNFFRWVLCFTEPTASELGDWSQAATSSTVVRKHYNQGQDTQLAMFGTRQLRMAWETQCCGAHTIHPSKHFVHGEPTASV